MQARDFVFWLQGYFELSYEAHGELGLTQPQVKMIREHLAMVFKHDRTINPQTISDLYKPQSGSGSGGGSLPSITDIYVC